MGESDSKGLSAWLTRQIDDAEDVLVTTIDQLEAGHSNEMLLVTLQWRAGSATHRQEAVIRLQPPSPGLLEPYDLVRQFAIMKALEPTPVCAPPALFLEPTGEVLGRPFMVMERMPGTVFDERRMPEELRDDPERVRGLTESFADQIATIHGVDLTESGLDSLGDGTTYLDRELDRWQSEIRRVARGPLPGLERLHDELRRQQPERTPGTTLVHGDAKPGNLAFVGKDVSAVFDWEMADVGDPMADVGYAEVLWDFPTFTSHAAALTADEFVARWEQASGLTAHDRHWYRALAAFKLAAIMLLGGWLVEARHSDDIRLAHMAMALPVFGNVGLRELGVTEPLDFGDHAVSAERLAEIDRTNTPPEMQP